MTFVEENRGRVSAWEESVGRKTVGREGYGREGRMTATRYITE